MFLSASKTDVLVPYNCLSFYFTNKKYQQTQKTTCIKAQKWPPTKLTHIIMNNSCVVPLTETDMEIGDRHYVRGQNGVKGYDP